MKIEDLTADDIKNIENMHTAKEKGFLYSSTIVTTLYNKMFEKKVSNTNCGSCIRKRIDAIYSEYLKIKELTTIEDATTVNSKENASEGNKESAEGGKM